MATELRLPARLPDDPWDSSHELYPGDIGDVVHEGDVALAPREISPTSGCCPTWKAG